MKVEWNRSRLWGIIAGVVLIIAFYILGQRVILDPYQERVAEKEATLAQEQKILSAIENNQEESDREQILSSRTIQQQLPVIPLIDQMLIGLDRAENASTSLITSIGIADSESSVSILQQEDELKMNGENDESEEVVDLQSDEPVEDEAGQRIEGLHTLQFNVDVTSENYDEMVSFMKEIQSLSRVIQIESIQFDAPESENELGYSIVMNSYYQPLYANLANEAPQYHYGGSSNKVDPFAIEQWDNLKPSASTRTEETDQEESLDEEGRDRVEENEEESSGSEAESQL
ncbi:hypothetical protein LC065_10950 [Halobacillus litoralis]|uniref:hypothetical protein n=1 Tax=Halobacillus litoralis TaxID=45668 RepID=UPI001CFF4D37|nr:hypothetical protein [Halobacillus litoralis]WLR46127.1 hypothetical protein LC065_10950 [Halobacillus litoralis]